MMLKLLDTERDGQFNLREWIDAMFVADFLSATHVLRKVKLTPEQWWFNANLEKQWDNGDRASREDALRIAMRFNNTLDVRDYEGPAVAGSPRHGAS